MTVSHVCPSPSPTFAVGGEEGERPQQNACLDVEGFPQHSTFSAGFNRIKNRYLFFNSCSQIRPHHHHFIKKLLSGWRGGADSGAPSLPRGFLSRIIRSGRGQTLFFCRRLYLENKAVSGDGFRSPTARPAPARRAPGAVASHHARLDVLVGDLLVVVRAAAG